MLAKVTGQVASLSAFQQRFFVDPSSIYLAGRALGAVCGALGTVVTAILGRTLFDRPTGLAAAALLAVAPVAVMDAHYVKHDVPATLAIVIALWRLACCWPEGGATGRVPARDLGVAAMACGIAWSTHYYSVFLVLPLVATVVDARRREGGSNVAMALVAVGATAAATFFVLSPFLLVEPGTAWRDIVANRQIVVDRATDHGSFANLFRYAELLVGIGATLPVAAASAIGTVLLIATDRRRALLLLSFPVPFLLFIGNTVPASRYLNPVLPIVALTAAVALRRLSVLLAPRRQGSMLAVLTLLAGTPALIDSVRVVTLFSQDDTPHRGRAPHPGAGARTGHHPDPAVLGAADTVTREPRGVSPCQTGIA